MASPAVKQLIYRTFTKKHGLSLKVDATRYLEELIEEGETSAEKIEEVLEEIVRAYTKHDANAAVIVDRISLERAVNSLQVTQQPVDTPFIRNQGNDNIDAMDEDADVESSGQQLDVTQHFHVVDAFKMPKWNYAHDQKTFVRATEELKFLASASAKGDVHRDRFDLLRQRILRNENFCPPAFQMSNLDAYLKITAIKALLGREGEQFLLFGMLTQLQEGKVHLEDADGSIELDLSACKTGTGLYTDNCFVLAEGTYTDDEVFRVDEMGLPPPERRSVTSSAFGHLDFLGAPSSTIDEVILEQEEKANSDIAFVIISDVWLDQPKTMFALRTIFEGYANALVPLAIILIGNFVSKPFLYSGIDSAKYKESFSALADLILEFPTLASFSHFVFVPGSHDPWGGNIFPRPPIPDFFTTKIRNKVKRCFFASNPCRIKYFTQEIVIFREDVLGKLRRNTLIPPNLDQDEEDITKHLIRTILDEAHLCPLPMQIRPIYWAYDHALRLYPMPHVIVLADRCENYGVSYEGCHCINPGSFPNSDFTWSIYYPATRRSERCALPSPR